MKKTFFVCVLLCAITAGFASAEAEKEYKYTYQESEVTYKNVNIFKILDHKDAYVVIYAKGHRDTGNVIIPKKWSYEMPKKLTFRSLPTGMSPYMTVINRGGSFERVVITMPLTKGNPYWGLVDTGVEIDADKDTLEIEY